MFLSCPTGQFHRFPVLLRYSSDISLSLSPPNRKESSYVNYCHMRGKIISFSIFLFSIFRRLATSNSCVLGIYGVISRVVQHLFLPQPLGFPSAPFILTLVTSTKWLPGTAVNIFHNFPSFINFSCLWEYKVQSNPSLSDIPPREPKSSD